MCGIFGLVASNKYLKGSESLDGLISKLFLLSQNRGSQASGIAVSDRLELAVFRKAQTATRMLQSKEYRNFINQRLNGYERVSGTVVIGHSRLVTNGSQCMENNNQPVITDHCVGVHNGIIVNDSELWALNSDLVQQSQLDTEIFFRLFGKYYRALWD